MKLEVLFQEEQLEENRIKKGIAALALAATTRCSQSWA
jgi:hypothetical protein